MEKGSFGKAFEDGIVRGLRKEMPLKKDIAEFPEKITHRLGSALGVLTGKTAKALDVLQFLTGPK